MATSLTTNFPDGITNAASTSAMGTLTEPDPTKLHTYFNDFNLYDASDWVVTVLEIGSGSAIQTIVDQAGGILELINDDGVGDGTFLQLKNETFKFVSGKKFHFKARFSTIVGTSFFGNSSFVIGIQIRDTTPLDVSDGVYFIKPPGVTLNLHVRKNSVSSVGAVGTLAATTTYEVAFIYDGKSEVQYWLDGILKGTLGVDNLPDDEELTVSFGHLFTGGAVKMMSYDYIYVASER